MSIADYLEREDLSGDLADLADQLGIEAARRIFDVWRGCCLNIPNRPSKRSIRRYLTQEMRQGRRLRDLARELNVTERYAQRLLYDAKTDEAQMLLFPEPDGDGTEKKQ